MELADAPRCKLERRALCGRKRAACRLHFRGPYAKTPRCKLHTIEAGAELDQRAVAAPPHGGDYFRYGRVDDRAVAAAPLEHRVEKAAEGGAMRVQDGEFHAYAASSPGTRSTVAPSARSLASSAS